MSLVAYGSSDDESGSDSEVSLAKNDLKNSTKLESLNASEKDGINLPKNLNIRMSLPTPKNEQISIESAEENVSDSDTVIASRLGLESLPQPRIYQNQYGNILEDDDIPLFKPKEPVIEIPTKKHRPPARISVPSLSQFKDVDEDLEQKKRKPEMSKKGCSLISFLPPPKNETLTKKSNLIPHVLTKSAANSVSSKISTKLALPRVNKPAVPKVVDEKTEKMLPMMDYDSNSEDSDEDHQDFFSLSKPLVTSEIAPLSNTNFFTIPTIPRTDVSHVGAENNFDVSENTEASVTMEVDQEQNCTLVSTVMNLPRDEILLKNKAEIGPKLPVPEQEFNVDNDGNVAFDEKAIEYLCGKRGVKRKNKMIDEANIIEINGEDIKPDEREWLVKAMTEEPVQRPVSMQGAGPSSQSKKKHQITYLAHQAKAMEVELKNSWSQNRMARKQTQSKYGF